MANSSKRKGDAGEREALRTIRALLPDLVIDGNDRSKSAGIPHDRGDLHVFPDTTVQVKHWKRERFGQALMEAADGARTQALHDHKPLGIGLSSIAGARASGVRWVASMTPDTAAVLGLPEPVAEFKSVTPLRAWISDDAGPYGYRAWARTERICLFTVSGTRYVACPIEAFAESYRAYRSAEAAASGVNVPLLQG